MEEVVVTVVGAVELVVKLLGRRELELVLVPEALDLGLVEGRLRCERGLLAGKSTRGVT